MKKIIPFIFLLAASSTFAEGSKVENADCTKMKTYKLRTECLAKQGKTEDELAREHGGGSDNSPRLLDEVEKIQADRKAEEKLAKQRAEKVKDLFSPWDGSSFALVRATKNAMNDPKSFEHVETTHVVRNDGKIEVFMRFRGKNAFGGVVLQTVVGVINIDTGELEKFNLLR